MPFWFLIVASCLFVQKTSYSRWYMTVYDLEAVEVINVAKECVEANCFSNHPGHEKNEGILNPRWHRACGETIGLLSTSYS